MNVSPSMTPAGCVCAYTWDESGGRVVRNGPRPDCLVHQPKPVSHCATCGAEIQLHICMGPQP